MKNLTQTLKSEMVSRNPAYLFSEDLPEIKGEFEFHLKDEFGFGINVKDISFQKLNYLLSLLISAPFQETENEDGKLSNTYSCKVQKCFAHLIEKDGYIEILILQDSDEKPIAVEASVKLVEKVGGVMQEVNQELNDLMAKLKGQMKNNEMFDEEFNKLSDSLNIPLEKSLNYQDLFNDIEQSFETENGFKDLPELIIKLDELEKKFKQK